MNESSTQVIVLGSLPSEAISAIGEAAADLDAPIRIVARASELRNALAHTGARVVIVDGSADAARTACDAIRGDTTTERTALLAMTRARTDVAFLEMYQWGADDLVDIDARALARRLRAIMALTRGPTGKSSPFVVVAGLDPRWRSLAARALSNAGIDTRLASDGHEALVRSEGAAFVFAADDLGPHGVVAAVTAARVAGSKVPWVIATPPKRFAEIQASVSHLDGIACIDAFTPAENVVFLGNEIARAVPTNKRGRATNDVRHDRRVSRSRPRHGRSWISLQHQLGRNLRADAGAAGHGLRDVDRSPSAALRPPRASSWDGRLEAHLWPRR